MYDQLERDLKKAPPGERTYLRKIIIGLAFALGIAIWLLTLVTFEELKKERGFYFSVLFLAAGFILSFVAAIIGIRKAKQNGRESLEFLRENNLMHQAEREYVSHDGFRLECRESHYRWRKEKVRTNLLTENFIFIMNHNVVITYDRIGSAVVSRDDYYDVEDKSSILSDTIVSDTIYLRLTDGTRVDLHNVNDLKYNSEQGEIARKIFAKIREKKPTCSIDISIVKDYISLPELPQDEN